MPLSVRAYNLTRVMNIARIKGLITTISGMRHPLLPAARIATLGPPLVTRTRLRTEVIEFVQ